MKDYIFRKNISVKQFAGDLEISTSYLYQLIRGERKPSIELAQKIEQLTEGEVSVERLLGFRNSSAPIPKEGTSDIYDERFNSLNQRVEQIEMRLTDLEKGKK